MGASAVDEAHFDASGFRFLDDWGSEDPLFMEENLAQHMRALTSNMDGITWPSCQQFYGLTVQEHDYCLSLDPSNCFYGNCPVSLVSAQ